MKPVLLAGLALIALGILGFVFPRISFTQSETVIDIGPVQVEAERQRNVSIPDIASGAAIVAGIALTATSVAGRRDS